MTTGHAIFAPSAAHRWLHCGGSIAMATLVPRDPSTVHAAEGTVAHGIADQLVTWSAKNTNDAEYLKKVVGSEVDCDGHAIAVSPEMVDHTVNYRDVINDIAKAAGVGTKVYAEQHLTTAIDPDLHGTGDAVIVSDNEIHIVDLKYGKGVFVEVESNPQLIIYLLGAIAKFGERPNYTVSVYQPRHARGPSLRSWSPSQIDVDFWAFDISSAISAIRAAPVNKPDCKPGPWCSGTWCPARAICYARLQQLTELQLQRKGMLKLSNDQLAFVLDREKSTIKYVNEVRDEALDRLLKGTKVSGYKAIRSKSRRKWLDIADVEKIMQTRDPFFDIGTISTTKLIGVTDAKKIIDKEVLETLVTTPIGKPTVVPEGAPGETIVTAMLEKGDFELDNNNNA